MIFESYLGNQLSTRFESDVVHHLPTRFESELCHQLPTTFENGTRATTVSQPTRFETDLGQRPPPVTYLQVRGRQLTITPSARFETELDHQLSPNLNNQPTTCLTAQPYLNEPTTFESSCMPQENQSHCSNPFEII